MRKQTQNPIGARKRPGDAAGGNLAWSGAVALIAGVAIAGSFDAEAAPKPKKRGAQAASAQTPDQREEIERLKRQLEAVTQENRQLRQQAAGGGQAQSQEAADAAAAEAAATAAAEQDSGGIKLVSEKDFNKDEPKSLGEVTVTARRKEEKLQDVPIPIAVVTGETLRRDNIVSVQDFSRRVPNLGVTAANTRQTSIALRGLGKNSGNESMESSVGVQVDNVWASWVGSTWANYTDIDHVEVLRGPQGTLQGKNSNLGLLNVVTKAPSFTSSYSVDGFAGNRDSLQGKVSATGPIVQGLLAYRASLYIDRRDGYLKNFDYPVTVGKIGETNALGGRLQFLWTPADTLSGRFILDRSSSTQTMSANPLLADPATFADGTPRTTSFTSRLARDWFDTYRQNGRRLSVIGDPRGYAQNDKQVSRGDQQGASGEFNWDVAGHRLTSISAYRYSLFEPHHDGDNSIASISQIGGVTVRNRQWSQEFRITSKDPGPIDYQVGVFAMRSGAETLSQNLYGADAGAFFASNGQYNTLSGANLSNAARAAGRELLRQSLNGILRQQFLAPETTSLAGFGQINWHITDKATLTLGLRNTWEHRDNRGWQDSLGGAGLAAAGAKVGASQKQIDAAKAIRGNVLGIRWVAARQGFDQNSQNWLANPSYKFNENLMAYFSVSGGQKSGAAQFNGNTGTVQNVDPEDILDFELGIKSQWFNRRLTANLNLYETNIRGFQSQLTNACDSSQPGCASGFITLLGNVKGIQLRGVELETNWNAIDGLNLFLNGSYNHAVYTDFTNAPCPPEANKPQCDQTGLTIPNAPAFTVNYGVDYKVPFGLGRWDDHGLVWHAYLVDSYKSSANFNASLSKVGYQRAYHVTDGGIGIATKNGQYSLDLVGRNIFDTIYVTNVGNWSGTGASSATYGDARYYGAHFRANF